MLSIAHVVNPVVVDPTSDLYTAQPITFAALRRAQAFAGQDVDVELFVACYEEDAAVAPEGFARLPWLERSVLDVADFAHRRRLPLLHDIIDRLALATKADYLIYSNVDIAPMPHFFLAVRDLVRTGSEALVVNRRTIEADYEPAQLGLMYSDLGQAHKGWDCFVFKRALWPSFDLGQVCLGAARSGLALLANLVALDPGFREVTGRHLTFHLGDRRDWLRPEYAAYDAHNTAELMALLARLEVRYGAFPASSIPGAFLRRKRFLGPLYEWWSRHVYLPPPLSRALNWLARGWR